jgi:hypothetical protein
VFLAAISAIAAVLGIYVHAFPGPLAKEHSIWAEFGDFVGGTLNPAMSFLTVALLVATLRLQAKELDLTRKELAETRSVVERQASALDRQVFEQTFFQMLRFFNDVLTSIDINPKEPRRGRDAMRIFADRLKNEISTERYNRIRDLPVSEREQPIDIIDIRRGYEVFYAEHEHEIAQYFRVLYNVLKFVCESDVSDKTRYTNILRAQLSRQELELIAVNMLHERASKLRRYAEEASLLKHLACPRWLTADAFEKLLVAIAPP